jgi:hypothetical protein
MPNHHLLLLFPASNGPIIKKLLSASKFSLTLKPVFEALVQILLIIKPRISSDEECRVKSSNPQQLIMNLTGLAKVF